MGVILLCYINASGKRANGMLRAMSRDTSRAISIVRLFPATKMPRSSRYANRRSERTWLFGFLYE